MVICAVLALLSAYGLAARFVLWRHDARPLPESERRWQRAAARLSSRAGVSAPRLYVIPESTPNALVALGAGGPVVAVTEGLLRRSTAQEVEAVMARCLDRLREEPLRLRLQSTAAVLLGFANSVLRFATWGMLAGEAVLGAMPAETAPLFVLPLGA